MTATTVGVLVIVGIALLLAAVILPAIHRTTRATTQPMPLRHFTIPTDTVLIPRLRLVTDEDVSA